MARTRWVRVVVAAVALPPIAFVVVGWLTILAAGNFDVAYAWGISGELASAIPVLIGGLLAGLGVGVIVGAQRLGRVWTTISGLGGLMAYGVFIGTGWDVTRDGWLWLLVWAAASLSLGIVGAAVSRSDDASGLRRRFWCRFP